jgi:hypothetical protein
MENRIICHNQIDEPVSFSDKLNGCFCQKVKTAGEPLLYFEWDKITNKKKTQISRTKSQEPRPTLKPRLEFET